MSSSQAASQVNRVSLILRCGFWVHIWNTTTPPHNTWWWKVYAIETNLRLVLGFSRFRTQPNP